MATIQRWAKHLRDGGKIAREGSAEHVKLFDTELLITHRSSILHLCKMDDITADDWDVFPEESTDVGQALLWISEGFRIGTDNLPDAGYVWLDLVSFKICAIRDIRDNNNDSPNPALILFSASKFRKLDKQLS